MFFESDCLRTGAASPPRSALSRTTLRLTSPARRRNSRHFGCASPAQAAKAVPALTKTAAVAGLITSEIVLLLVSGFFRAVQEIGDPVFYVITIVKTKTIGPGVICQVLAGKIFEIETAPDQVAQFECVAKIEHVIFQYLPVVQQDLVNLLCILGFFVKQPGQSAFNRRGLFSAAVIISGTAGIIAELAVFPSGAKLLSAFKTEFFVCYVVFLWHVLIVAARLKRL